jgi:uncharacterized membrane protein YsdA (DUF1294 family)/cold shock CspA family protein
VRRQGNITKWKDDQGFGFITPTGGGEPVFVHIKSFTKRHRPRGNEFVTYEVGYDQKGRLRAENVAFVGDTATNGTERQTALFAIPGLFLLFVGLSVFMGRLPSVVLGLYLLASAVSYLAYAHDKSAAQKNHWRTPESTLHLISLIGGWPGAFVAQNLLRHKSKKLPFRIVFWATVVLNCVVLLWLFSPASAGVLNTVLGRLD